MIADVAGDAGEQADQGFVQLPPRRAGALPGRHSAALPGAGLDESLQPGSGLPRGKAGHAGDGRVQSREFGLRGEQVAGGRADVEHGGFEQRRDHVFWDAGCRVLLQRHPAGHLVRGAAQPRHERQLVGEEGPVRGHVPDHPGFTRGSDRGGAPPGEHACQQGGRDVGQPGCPGCREVGQDGPDLMELCGQVRDLHGPGGRAADRDGPVDPGVQEFPGGSPLAGIGDGGEVDPAASGGPGNERGDIPHVVGEPRAVAAAAFGGAGGQHERAGADCELNGRPSAGRNGGCCGSAHVSCSSSRAGKAAVSSAAAEALAAASRPGGKAANTPSFRRCQASP